MWLDLLHFCLVFFSLTINTNFVYSFFSVPSLQTIVVMFVFIVSEKALHRLGKKMMRLTAMRPWKWRRFLSFILLVSVSLSFSLSLSPLTVVNVSRSSSLLPRLFCSIQTISYFIFTLFQATTSSHIDEFISMQMMFRNDPKESDEATLFWRISLYYYYFLLFILELPL